MNISEKQNSVEKYKEMLESAAVLLMVDYSGLKSNDMNALRKKCREADVTLQVVKNTLVKRALEGSEYAFLADFFKGPIAVAFSAEDPVSPAKVLAKAAEDFDALELLAGGLEGQPLDVAAIERLSKMLGKDELRAQLLGLFDAVPGGFVKLLNAVPGGLVNVLDAKRRKMEEDEDAA